MTEDEIDIPLTHTGGTIRTDLVLSIDPQAECDLEHVSNRLVHRASKLKARVKMRFRIRSARIAHGQADPRPNR